MYSLLKRSVFLVASVLLASALSGQETTTTFRGHTLGEKWPIFIRSEAGLCELKQNTEDCAKAAGGAKVVLFQHAKDGSVLLFFEHARFASATTMMTGPSFSGLEFFEKAYGKASSKLSDPKTGRAVASWYFVDGGEAHAEERPSQSGGFDITFRIQSSEAVLHPGSLALNAKTPGFSGHRLGERWEEFIKGNEALCKYNQDSVQSCKQIASGEYDMVAQRGTDDNQPEIDYWFVLRRLTEVSVTMRVEKFVELDYLNMTYGHPYDVSSDHTNAQWEYADGGKVTAYETPMTPGFLISIQAKLVRPQIR
jgi:hypothetical protein